jgi:DNA-binding SARP family transcriptional activator
LSALDVASTLRIASHAPWQMSDGTSPLKVRRCAVMDGSQYLDGVLPADGVIEPNGHSGPGQSADGDALTLRLLQGFQLEWTDHEVDLPLSAQRVLAFLALQMRPQTRSYVAATLWVNFNEERARASLRSALWRINRCGHQLVTADAWALRLMPDIVVDLRESTRTAQKVLRGDPSGGDVQVDELVAGDLLPGWYDEWVVVEREHFRQLRLHALEKLCEQLADEGRFGEAVEAGLVAVSGEALRESAHRVLIRAYLKEGNRGEAIRQYEVCRQVLRRELGIDPSPVTQALLSSPWPEHRRP